MFNTLSKMADIIQTTVSNAVYFNENARILDKIPLKYAQEVSFG